MSMGNTRLQLNEFFISVQSKALKQVEFAVGDRDEAMDILQEAMIRLAKKYADDKDDWPRLFQRILQNLIKDWYRRKKVRSILVWWNQVGDNPNSVEEAVGQEIGDHHLEKTDYMTPEAQQKYRQVAEHVTEAVKALPFRQQQAFTLRAWWGHDVRETAFAMECSEGSVKTHYSRAVSRLRELLGDFEL